MQNQINVHIKSFLSPYLCGYRRCGETKIWESNKQKLLGVVIDRNLNFDEYVFDLCIKAGRKLSVLARLSNYMSFEKRKISPKAFVKSQFGYCQLTWMFHGRRANSKINHIHERALRIVYKNNVLSFEELLELDKSFKIHHRNIQSLAIELFKIKNNLSVSIMNDIFQPRVVRYNLRSQIYFTRPDVNSEHFGISSLRYMAAKVWDMKNVNEIETFKNNIRKWKPVNFHCKLCLDYVSCVGYVNTF